MGNFSGLKKENRGERNVIKSIGVLTGHCDCLKAVMGILFCKCMAVV